MTKSETGTFDPRITPAARDVLAERRRQIEVEGWTSEHDDEHDKGEIATAAACYALHPCVVQYRNDLVDRLWPWDDLKGWKPTTRRINLLKAGALILAEIERLDRAAGLVNVPPSDVPSEDGESDAAFVERLKDEDGWFNRKPCDRERLIALASRAIIPSSTPDAYRICDVTGRPWETMLTQDQVDRTLHSGPPGSYAEPLWRGRPQARAYRAGLTRGAEIAGEAAWRHLGEDAYSQGMDAGARHQVDKCVEAIEAEDAAASPHDPFKGHRCTPHEGEPFFVLLGRDKQAPAAVEKWAIDREAANPGDDKIASARARAAEMRAYSGSPAPQPDAAPEPAEWQYQHPQVPDVWLPAIDEAHACSSAHALGTTHRPLYIFPPAPVPAEEVMDDFGAHLEEPLGVIAGRVIGKGHVVLSEERYGWLMSRAALTAQPRANAGEVTKTMVEAALMAQRAMMTSFAGKPVSEEEAKERLFVIEEAALRAALAAREPRS